VSAASGIYEGWIRHRRFHPAEHSFRNRVALLYLDLDELPGLFRGRWLWSAERPALARFRREDHLGDPREPLAESVRALVAARLGFRPRGPVRLLTQPRRFGYVFNPISLFYCFGEGGRRLEAVVGEVTNTPWGERHCYVLRDPRPRGGTHVLRCEKVFHVSPFLGMDLLYDWRVTEPGRRLAVHIEGIEGGPAGDRPAGRRVLDATMVLERREITGGSLARHLLRYPLLPMKVIAAIHAQALRLYLKGAPVHPHPGGLRAPEPPQP